MTQKFLYSLALLGLLAGWVAGCGKRDSAGESFAPSAAAAAGQTSADSEGPKKVLVVHSYFTDYEWVNAINRGIRMSISPQACDLEFFYMDTKRRTGESWKKQQGAAALELIEDWQPDVVITVDDNAQAYVGRHLVGKDRPVVVFCGVNHEPQTYGYPASNVTGVLERLHFSQSLAFLKMLLPTAQRVVVLSDDSPTSEGALNYCRTQFTHGVDVVDMRTIKMFDQWKAAVKDYGSTVDAIAVYTYHTLQAGEAAESVPPAEVMDWTVGNSDVPILGFLTFAVDDGSLCGVLESGVEQGQLAGDLVGRFWAGTPIRDIPIVTGSRGQTMVNLSSAKKYGIDIAPEILSTVDLVVNGKSQSLQE